MIRQQSHSSPDTTELSSLAQDVMRFRQHLEAEAAEPISALEVNAALLLSDLCQFLGLDTPQRSQVLGPYGTRYLATILATQVKQTPNQQYPCTYEG